MTRSAWAVLAAIAALAGCSGATDDPEAVASTTTAAVVAPTETTAPPTFTGDGSSAFCLALADADDRPVLDPFEAGLEAREVELRLRALVVRAGQLSDAAPPELAADVSSLAAGLAAVDETLAAHEYDFGAAGAADADLSFLDAAEFVDVGVRIAAYRAQVCDP